ncbi:MAG: PhoH family protein, partial [Bifidobacterium mongoliense]|nr:PhoH family protein [Bifidobacterium mongoliense]
NTKMVITGYITHIDIAVVEIDAGDVVRHALVGAIVEAYDRHTQRVMRRKEGNDRNGQRGAAL